MDAATKQRFTKARIGLLLDAPFFGTLATRLENILDPNIPTACTNGRVIRWNPTFLAKLPDAHLRGVLAHEILHVANGHTWRRGSRDAMGWNIAADRAINSILNEAGFSLPAGGIYPDRGDEGKSAEHYYTEGQRGGPGGKTPQKGQSGGDQPGCGEVEDAPEGDKEEQEAEWRVAVAQAAAGAGHLPAGLARLVDEIVNPKVPWEVLLRDFVEQAARNDYNWNRPNRRYTSSGIILPSLVSEELPDIVVAVDTSGSIGAKQLDAFAAEASAVLGAYETTIHVAYFDTEVAGSETITRADLPIQLKPKGGGGTSFCDIGPWVDREGITPACIIILTDMDGAIPTTGPDCPVLWVSTKPNRKAPFGDVVYMEI